MSTLPPTVSSEEPLHLRSRMEAVVAGLVFIGVVLLGLWLLLCGVASLWLAYKVPISQEDLAWASWAGSYSLAAFLRHGAVLFEMTVVIMGMAMAIAKNSLAPLAMGLMVGVAIYGAASLPMHVRMGVADGNIRLGCYVWKSKECRQMLGVPASDAPSMYQTGEHAGEFAPWYVAEAEDRSIALIDFMPGGYFLAAPFYALHADLLNKKLEVQRQAVRAFRAANGVNESPGTVPR